MQFWTRNFCAKLPSASSWGCELKYCCRCGNHLRRNFVRLWVEMIQCKYLSLWFLSSASSWGCELKYYYLTFVQLRHCQPLREAVSWNHGINHRKEIIWPVSLFVRLWVEISLVSSSRPRKYMSASSWGCELKYVRQLKYTLVDCSQPLREAVSWNIWLMKLLIPELLSASSWGCELK